MNLLEIRTGVPELRGPAVVCLSAIDKNSAYCFLNIIVYWSSSWAGILNVQDIIKERTNSQQTQDVESMLVSRWSRI